MQWQKIFDPFTECIYRQKLETLKQVDYLIDDFIHFYSFERLLSKTGLTPLMQRQSFES